MFSVTVTEPFVMLRSPLLRVRSPVMVNVLPPLLLTDNNESVTVAPLPMEISRPLSVDASLSNTDPPMVPLFCIVIVLCVESIFPVTRYRFEILLFVVVKAPEIFSTIGKLLLFDISVFPPTLYTRLVISLSLRVKLPDTVAVFPVLPTKLISPITVAVWNVEFVATKSPLTSIVTPFPILELLSVQSPAYGAPPRSPTRRVPVPVIVRLVAIKSRLTIRVGLLTKLRVIPAPPLSKTVRLYTSATPPTSVTLEPSNVIVGLIVPSNTISTVD